MVEVPQTVFHVHELTDDSELGTYVGGSDDLPSAVAIMSAVYTAAQGYSVQVDLTLVVVDDNGNRVAFIGRSPQMPGLPA